MIKKANVQRAELKHLLPGLIYTQSDLCWMLGRLINVNVPAAS